MPHLSPTTLIADDQRLLLRATAGNVRDHAIISLALGTGLRLAEIVGMARSKRLHAEAGDTTAVELDRLRAKTERMAREKDDHNSPVGGVQVGC